MTQNRTEIKTKVFEFYRALQAKDPRAAVLVQEISRRTGLNHDQVINNIRGIMFL